MYRPILLYTYLVLTVLFPIIFRLINRKLTWLSIVSAVAVELIMYWDHFCYYESRGLAIYVTLIQILIMILIIIIINLIDKKEK